MDCPEMESSQGEPIIPPYSKISGGLPDKNRDKLFTAVRQASTSSPFEPIISLFKIRLANPKFERSSIAINTP
jgi:hypothetical protein